MAMTDYTRFSAPNYYASRTFDDGAPVNLEELFPVGALENLPLVYTPKGMINKSLPALIFRGDDLGSFVLPSFDEASEAWSYNFGFPIAATAFLRIGMRANAQALPAPKLEMVSTVTGSIVTIPLTFIDGWFRATALIGSVVNSPFFLRWIDPPGFTVQQIDVSLELANGFHSEEILYFEQSTIVDQVVAAGQSQIVLGMTTWAEYQGSTLDNGGDITGYRYPRNTWPILGELTDAYEEVSSTPQAYFGPLKNGAFSYWLPDSTAEMTFGNIRSMEIGNFTYIVGRKDDTTQTVRINFNQMILVSTFSQAFPQVHVPIGWDAISSALNVLRSSPTCSSNSNHKGAISKALKWLSLHKTDIKKGAISAAEFAAKAAPVFAALLAV